MDYLKYLNDYINGEEIEDELREELENNVEFMIAVINKTNDKKMYIMCDQNIKYEPKLLIFLINKFSNDQEFVLDLVRHYLNNDSDRINFYLDGDFDIEKLEVLLITSNLFGYSEDSRVMRVRLALSIFFNEWYTKTSLALTELTEKEKKLIGLGFVVIDMTYSNKIIKDFFAKQIVDKILEELITPSLENYFHRLYKEKQPAKEFELFINLIGKYDDRLRYYIITNKKYFSDYVKNIKRILNNWENYENNQIYQLVNIIYEEVIRFREENYNIIYTEFDIMAYFGELLNITSKIKEFLPEVYENSMEEFDEKHLSIRDRAEFKKLKSTIYDIFNNKLVDYDSYSNPKEYINTIVKEYKKSRVD